MRLFTGISLPEAFLYRVASLLGPLRLLADIRWSPASNLHITTKFIGEWPGDRLSELAAALSVISSPAFEVELSGLGWFPSPQSPHVFWMGVHGGDALPALAARTDAALYRPRLPKRRPGLQSALDTGPHTARSETAFPSTGHRHAISTRLPAVLSRPVSSVSIRGWCIPKIGDIPSRYT